MLAEYNRQQAELSENQKQTQIETDCICREIFNKSCDLLTTSKDVVNERHPWKALFNSLTQGNDAWIKSPINPSEMANQWKMKKGIDLGSKHPESVTLIGFGGRTPDKAHKISLSIQGFPHLIQLSKYSGVIWNRETEGGKDYFYKSEVTPLQAKLFKEVLEKFSASK